MTEASKLYLLYKKIKYYLCIYIYIYIKGRSKESTISMSKILMAHLVIWFNVLLFYSLIYLKRYLLNFNIVNHVYKKGQVAFLGYVLKPIKVYNLN